MPLWLHGAKLTLSRCKLTLCRCELTLSRSSELTLRRPTTEKLLLSGAGLWRSRPVLTLGWPSAERWLLRSIGLWSSIVCVDWRALLHTAEPYASETTLRFLIG